MASQESAAALQAQAHWDDAKYDRNALLDELKAAYAADSTDVGVMWRLTRAAYDVAHLNATSADKKKELIYYAYDLIQKAEPLGKNIAEVHNWIGIILSAIGDYEGTKVAISNAYKIKEHWEESIRIQPDYPPTYFLLGNWCVRISDLSWIERKAASVLFGSPPQSSYDEALKFLLKHEELKPLSWKRVTILIAEVYYKKKDWAKAKEWAEKTMSIEIKNEEDAKYQEDAKAMLKKL
ncbi:hypothetical protein P43SY_004813 [Pythium insidiosum]|uniref:Regulator of microtubule dynamics protein 1 n=1 Tax=Pythium insidiosum TaxID=114742 RepID=A0AAD5LJ75_PYTIN|nr:hypothetical protein P43SY_004813 [Pythium insidiosum]KAJ0406890.1 hypothetical protein ATCC90586_001471 [Pythium insidiosum]